MGETTDDVTAQIKELQRHLHEEAARTAERFASLDRRLDDLVEGLGKAFNVAFDRGHYIGRGGAEPASPVALVPDPDPAAPQAPSVAPDRRRALMVACAATLIVAVVAYAAWAGRGHTQAPDRGLTASARDAPHGPPVFAVTPRPAPTLPRPTASGAFDQTGAHPAAGRATDPLREVDVPAATPTSTVITFVPVAAPPGSDCGVGVQVRRLLLCRSTER